MTGAGSATALCFGKESLDDTPLPGTLQETDGSPDLWSFGRDPALTELNLDRALARMRDATSAEAVEAIAGKLDGAVGIEGAVTDLQEHIHEIVFVDGTGFEPGRPPFSRVVTGVSHHDGTVDRELQGCVPLEYSLSYDTDTETVTYSLSLGYTNEPDDPMSVDPANVTTPSMGSTAAFHGFTFSLDGADVAKLSTCELSISNISRFHYGASATPVDATIAAPEVEVTATATFTSGSQDRLELAYGGSGASSPDDRMESVGGEIDVAGPSGSLANFTLPQVKLNDQSWENVVATEDTQDSITGYVTGGIEVA